MGCCLLVAPVVSRRPWEAGEEHKERRTDGRKVSGQVMMGSRGGVDWGCVFTCHNRSWAVAAGRSLVLLCSRSRRAAEEARPRWALL